MVTHVYMYFGFTILAVIFHEVCANKKNVLFLVVDDLRPALGAYRGLDAPSHVHPSMHTPNIDKLSRRSLLLKRAYCQQALCSPSRASFLTGRRPDTTHVYDLYTYFRKSGGNFTTIPQFFKNNGYHSVGIGKIFHPGKLASGQDDPISWSEAYFHGEPHGWETNGSAIVPVPDQDLINKPLKDQQIADRAVQTLRRLAPAAKSTSNQNPFFLAVGFHKPHLPFVFPASMQDFYPEDSIHLPDNPYVPENFPPIAWNSYNELRNYYEVKQVHATGSYNTTLPPSLTKRLRRAYYSAVSFVDSLVGEVLNELDALGLRNDTIVSFIGDHGWYLGEHAEWGKWTNMEMGTHSPMMVSIPGKTDAGIVTRKMTELVDMFPTLVEAAGFQPLPLCPYESSHLSLCREGTSLMPLVDNPHWSHWKTVAFSQYPKTHSHKQVMGYTIRTHQYRYTEWVEFQGHPHYQPIWSNSFGTELYDHIHDPEENHNIADQSQYADVQRHLSATLQIGWRGIVS